MRTKQQRVTDKTHIAKDEDSHVESSVAKEADEFLDEVDKLLEDQDALVRFRQRGGQ